MDEILIARLKLLDEDVKESLDYIGKSLDNIGDKARRLGSELDNMIKKGFDRATVGRVKRQIQSLDHQLSALERLPVGRKFSEQFDDVARSVGEATGRVKEMEAQLRKTERPLKKVSVFTKEWWQDFGRVAIGFTIAYRTINAIEASIRNMFDLIKEGVEYQGELVDLQAKMAMWAMMFGSNAKSYTEAFQMAAPAIREFTKEAIRSVSSTQDLTQAIDELMQHGMSVTPENIGRIVKLADLIAMVAKTSGASVNQVRQELQALFEGTKRAGNTLLVLIHNLGPQVEALVDQIREGGERGQEAMDALANHLVKFMDEYRNLIFSMKAGAGWELWRKQLMVFVGESSKVAGQLRGIGARDVFASVLVEHIKKFNEEVLSSERRVKEFALALDFLAKVFDLLLSSVEVTLNIFGKFGAALDLLTETFCRNESVTRAAMVGFMGYMALWTGAKVAVMLANIEKVRKALVGLAAASKTGAIVGLVVGGLEWSTQQHKVARAYQQAIEEAARAGHGSVVEGFIRDSVRKHGKVHQREVIESWIKYAKSHDIETRIEFEDLGRGYISDLAAGMIEGIDDALEGIFDKLEKQVEERSGQVSESLKLIGRKVVEDANIDLLIWGDWRGALWNAKDYFPDWMYDTSEVERAVRRISEQRRGAAKEERRLWEQARKWHAKAIQSLQEEGRLEKALQDADRDLAKMRKGWIETHYEDFDQLSKLGVEATNEWIRSTQEALDNYFRDLDVEIPDRWKSLMNDVEQITTDAIYGIFTGWEEGWEGFLRGMKRLFLRTVSEMIAESLSKQIIIPVAASFMGGMGVPGYKQYLVGAAAQGLPGHRVGSYSAGQYVGAFGRAFVTGNWGDQLVSLAADTDSALLLGIGEFFQTHPVAGYGLTGVLTGLTTYLTTGSWQRGLGSGLGAFGGQWLSSAVGSALGGTLGSVVPIVGTMVGAMIGDMIGKWLGRGSPDRSWFWMYERGALPQGAGALATVRSPFGEWVVPTKGRWQDLGFSAGDREQFARDFLSHIAAIDRAIASGMSEATREAFTRGIPEREMSISWRTDSEEQMKTALKDFIVRRYRRAFGAIDESLMSVIRGGTVEDVEQSVELATRIVALSERIPDFWRRFHEALQEGWDEASAYQQLQSQYDDVAGLIISPIQQAIVAALGGEGGAEAFEFAFDGQVKEIVGERLISAFTQSMMQSLLEGEGWDVLTGFGDVLNEFVRGELDVAGLERELGTVLEFLSGQLENLDPRFQELIDLFREYGLVIDQTSSRLLDFYRAVGSGFTPIMGYSQAQWSYYWYGMTGFGIGDAAAIRSLVDRLVGEPLYEFFRTGNPDVLAPLNELVESLTPEQVQALQALVSVREQEALQIKQFNDDLDSLVAQNTLGSLSYQLWQLNRWYEEQVELAGQLGLETNRVNEAYAAQLQSIRRGILDQFDSLDQLVWQARNPDRAGWVYYAERVREMVESGEWDSSLDSLNEWTGMAVQAFTGMLQDMVSASEQVEQHFEQARQASENIVRQIDSLVRDIEYSDLNVAVPRRRLEEAQRDYRELLRRALSGRQEDVQTYLNFVRTYLGTAQAAWKSSQTYQNIYAQVMQDIQQVRGYAGSQEFESVVVQELSSQTRQLDELIAGRSLDDVLGWIDSVSAGVEGALDRLLGASSPVVNTIESQPEPPTAEAIGREVEEAISSADLTASLDSSVTSRISSIDTNLDKLTDFMTREVQYYPGNYRFDWGFRDAMAHMSELLIRIADGGGGSVGSRRMENILVDILRECRWIASYGWITAMNLRSLNMGLQFHAYSDGGIAWNEQIARVGEEGPEAIIPLRNGGIPVEIVSGRNEDRPIYITVEVGGEEFEAIITRVADDVRVKAERRSLGVRRMR